MSVFAGRSVDETLHTMSRHLSLFQAVEQDLLQSKARMLTKVPDIQRSLKVVELLQRKRAAGQQVASVGIAQLMLTPLGTNLRLSLVGQAEMSADCLNLIVCRLPLTSAWQERSTQRLQFATSPL